MWHQATTNVFISDFEYRDSDGNRLTFIRDDKCLLCVRNKAKASAFLRRCLEKYAYEFAGKLEEWNTYNVTILGRPIMDQAILHHCKCSSQPLGDYALYVGQCDVDSPMHDLLKDLDPSDFKIKVSGSVVKFRKRLPQK